MSDTHSITLSSADLAGLLTDVRRAASDDDHLRMIAGVLLHTADGRLVATATDRYCALHGHVPVSGVLPAPVWLTNRQISQVLTIARPYTTRRRAAGSQVEIRVADNTVTVRQLALAGLAEISVSFPYDPGENFPKVALLISGAMERGASSDPWQVNARNLAVLTQIAARRDEYLRVRATGRHKPIVAQIGNSLVGIVMPVRSGAEGEQPLDVTVYPVTAFDEAAAA